MVKAPHVVMEQVDGWFVRKCLHCGATEPMPKTRGEISIRDFVALCDAFIKAHQHCQATPTPDQQDEQAAINEDLFWAEPLEE